MGTEIRGAGAGTATITPPNIEEPKKPNGTSQNVTSEQNTEVAQKSSAPAGRNAEGLAHDPAVAMRKAALSRAAGLNKPTKAQLDEIRNAIKDGKKEEAIKLTIKYYNIDTSGAHEVKYVAGRNEATPEASAGHNHDHAHDHGFGKIGTGTHQRNGKISIEIGDESFQFKGKDSPEWLAAAIYHESFHAKNHFNPNKPVIVTENTGQTPENTKMSQQEIAEEIQAYMHEQKAAGKLGLDEDMLSEINDRRNKLYAQLTPENREIIRPILVGSRPWPQ